MDPTKFSKEYLEEMEKLFVGQVGNMLRNPQFLKEAGKGMEAGLESRKAFNGSMKAYLEASNMPTRDDIARVLQYLQTIESRLLGLEEMMEDLSDRLPRKRRGKAKE